MLLELLYLRHSFRRYYFRKPYKPINLKRFISFLFAIIFIKMFYGILVGIFNRHTNTTNTRLPYNTDHLLTVGPFVNSTVLIFAENLNSTLLYDITTSLVHTRITYQVRTNRSIFQQAYLLFSKLHYSVIIFENLNNYLHMKKRILLDRYCRKYSIGIIGFVGSLKKKVVDFHDFSIQMQEKIYLENARLNPASNILRLTKASATYSGLLPGRIWTIFQYNHTTYEPIEWAEYNQDNINKINVRYTTVLQDHGHLDGVQRVFFGSDLKFCLHRLLFLDALSYLSQGQLSLSLNRIIAVDIDDIFISDTGTRLKPKDVLALIAYQQQIATLIPGFRFNLGFSGGGFHNGTAEENLADDLLLENVNGFNWFPHTWQHQSPHLCNNLTILMHDMILNYKFAEKYRIPTNSSYAVSPYHSGVYPVHELLYTAWKNIWNIKVTSTEEYPHKNPERLRRGFKYHNIMVLPRQTLSGLFTRHNFVDQYEGGRNKLDESIQGGELFQKIVYNPINIFMTHTPNYSGHQLALYALRSVLQFLSYWTNLKLSSAPPLQLGDTYFRLHPNEIDPVWSNPCDDPEHVKKWANRENCDSLPKFLVIGPQKTGTSALYTYLNLHPSLASNVPTPNHYEEMQFFNNHNYYRGLDWYMTFFPTTNNNTTRYMFEKSATYFDDDIVPKRAYALLPRAKIIIILKSPGQRAYSWYQHSKYQGNLMAQNYNFFQVITANKSAPKYLRDLRDRCLNPGKYSEHIERWLEYYPPENLHIIDGSILISNPIVIMNKLQNFLNLTYTYDYLSNLVYDVRKGFYCQIVGSNRHKCLGKSKGRKYPKMDNNSAKFLRSFYGIHNKRLVKLFVKLNLQPIPKWLSLQSHQLNKTAQT